MPLTNGEIFFNRLEAVKASILEILTPVALTNAKIEGQFIFDPDVDNWVNELLDSTEKVNCLQVWYNALGQGPTGEGASVGSIDPNVVYGVDYFIDYDKGSTAANSEKILARFFSVGIWEIAAHSELKMNVHEDLAIRGCVSHHTGLVVPAFRHRAFGTRPVHFGRGRLGVIMQEEYVRNQE